MRANEIQLGKYIGIFIVPLVISFCIILSVLFNLPFIQRLDDSVYDFFQRSNINNKVSEIPIIVDIDEKSLSEQGQWPWPRYLLSNLINKLMDAGSLAIGLDILLTEKDRSSPYLIKQELQKKFDVKLDILNLPENLHDHDITLAENLSKSKIVLGAFATFNENDVLPKILPKSIGLVEKNMPGAPLPRDSIEKATGILLPLEPFLKVSPIGTLNANTSYDGVVRSVPLLIKIGDKIYPSLALRTLMMAMNSKSLRLDSDMGGLSYLSVGKMSVRVNHDGSFNPLFNGRSRAYPYYSATDIIENRIGSEKLKNKIVFIGSSAAGLMDIRNTPVDPLMPGVEVHATIVDNILNGKTIFHPDWDFVVQIVLIFIVSLIAAMIFGFAPALLYLPIACIIIIGTFFSSWKLFENGLFLSPIPLALTLTISAICVLSLRFWREEIGRRQIRQAFSRYVSPEVVSKIADRGGKLFAGEQKNISVLFTDVRGFTSISEKLSPDAMVKLLNRYFTPMTACVKKYGGTMDKFVGDALMAFWNAPLDVQDHEKKSVLAAIAMQEKLEELRPKILSEFGVEINIGAGINTGLVHVGNMGSEDLLDYTCIGDNVNLASRLEGLCKYYGVGVVVSEYTVSACNDENIKFKKLDKIKVKGKTKPVEIFSPITSRELENNSYIEWENALLSYINGNFEKALHEFKDIKDKFEYYEVGCILFIDRCSRLLEMQPNNWDGVWKFDSK